MKASTICSNLLELFLTHAIMDNRILKTFTYATVLTTVASCNRMQGET